MLRRYIGDTASISYSDAELDDQLNISAQAVAVSMARNSLTKYTRGTYTLTPDGSDSYDIAVSDFHSLIDVRGGTADRGVEIVDERQFSRHYMKYPVDNVNSKDKYVAALIQDLSAVGGFDGGFTTGFATSSGYKIIFPYNLSVGDSEASFTVYYARTVNPILTGSAYDGQSFTGVPYQYQAAIPRHAAAQLLVDGNGDTAQSAMGILSYTLTDDMLDSKTRATPARTGS